MAESDKILTDNLKETLRQLQSYVIWGIGSSLSFLILSLSDFRSMNVTVALPGSFVPVSADFAKIIAVSIYWVAGALASYAHERAERIASRLNPELLDATLTFPSVATEYYPGVRALAALIPSGFILAGLISSWRKSEGELGLRIFLTAILLVPYITLFIELIVLPTKLKSNGRKDEKQQASK